MMSILILFVKVLIFVLVASAVVGVVAFWVDLQNFKSERNMSLPRRKLIETIIAEQELKAAEPQEQKQQEKQEEEEQEDSSEAWGENTEKEVTENAV